MHAGLDRQRAELGGLLRVWAQRHPPPRGGDGVAPLAPLVEITGMELLHGGDAELWGVSADVDGTAAHAVVAACPPDTSLQPLRGGDDPVLGVLDAGSESVVVVDALLEVQLACTTVETVVGADEHLHHAVLLDEGPEVLTVSFDERWSLSAFPWPHAGPHPGVTLLSALDQAGFNHLPAPVALWRRAGRDLGVVQEVIVGSARGDAVALTSLRDLYASGLAPQQAGGDFAPEAAGLGTMAARMHLALARAFGTEEGTGEAEAPAGPVMRTHGDLTLRRTARSDQGWVLADPMPGGCPPGSTEVLLRSPLADVADMEWSFGAVAGEAAQVRDPTGRLGAAALGRAWRERNAAAFWHGYCDTPGIEALLPADEDVCRRLVARYTRARATGVD